jgi:hypothetical protein
MNSRVQYKLIVAASAVGVLLVPSLCDLAFGQSSGMSFSVYNNTQVYNASLDLDGSVLDNSWGCSHGSYSTTARIYSPTNRTAASTSAGLSAEVTLPLNGEYGNFTLVTNVSYTCSCMMNSVVTFSDGRTEQPKVPANVQQAGSDYFTRIASGNYLRRRTWQVLDQTSRALARGGMSVQENFTIQSGQNGCNLSVFTGSTSTNSQGRFCDKYGNPAISDSGCTTSNNQARTIAACGTNPQCTSRFSQKYTISSYQLAPNTVTYGCLDVTITR